MPRFLVWIIEGSGSFFPTLQGGVRGGSVCCLTNPTTPPHIILVCIKKVGPHFEDRRLDFIALVTLRDAHFYPTIMDGGAAFPLARFAPRGPFFGGAFLDI